GLVLLPLAFIVHVILALTVHIKVLPFVFFPFRHPKWSTFIWIPIVAVVTTAAINQLPVKQSASHRLLAEKIGDVPIDIKAVPDLNWDAARPLKTRLVNGVGFDKGVTRLELRAMYDNTYLYMRAQWEDDTDSTVYWPIQKTAEGWKYLQNSLNDEQELYEDKFALLFPIDQSVLFDQVGCAAYCHQSSDTKRFPYGYKASKDPLDVWHWKAARTDPMGYVDDKYWQGHDTSLTDVGRKSDSGDKAGYLKNISEDHTHPLYLPKDENSVIKGAILQSGAVEYTEELGARIPEGTIIPGLVIHDIQGDRGDIRCVSEYKDGIHTLWMRRQLDTGSEYDVLFTPGESVSFAASAFDHAAKRHAYNMTSYKLLLKK
ncbi:MAG: hypothetical protein K9L89_06850, partial [Kiritimatiellales bacterium]|nr:hypothetical protein [Kiritimatiellales bacterium]